MTPQVPDDSGILKFIFWMIVLCVAVLIYNHIITRKR